MENCGGYPAAKTLLKHVGAVGEVLQASILRATSAAAATRFRNPVWEIKTCLWKNIASAVPTRQAELMWANVPVTYSATCAPHLLLTKQAQSQAPGTEQGVKLDDFLTASVDTPDEGCWSRN